MDDAHLVRVLDDLDERLARLERALAIEPPPLPPAAAEHGCGHTAPGKVTKRDGTTLCPACHEAEQLVVLVSARTEHQGRERQRQAQAESYAVAKRVPRG